MGYRTDRALILLPTTTITTAVTGQTSTAVSDLLGAQVAVFQAVFVYGSGGLTAKAWVQTTIDGTTWFDIANFAFTTASATILHSVRAFTAVAANYTPLDAALADNTIKDGVLGQGLRTKLTTTGTYAGGTTLTITAVVQGGYR